VPLGWSFRCPFWPLVFHPLFAFASFRRAVDGKVLRSPKPNSDCFVTVGAGEDTGCVECISLGISTSIFQYISPVRRSIV